MDDTSYLHRARKCYDRLCLTGLNSKDKKFALRLCKKLRLTGGVTETHSVQTRGGETVMLEVWRGTMTEVPRWFNDDE